MKKRNGFEKPFRISKVRRLTEEKWKTVQECIDKFQRCIFDLPPMNFDNLKGAVELDSWDYYSKTGGKSELIEVWLWSKNSKNEMLASKYARVGSNLTYPQ